MNTVQWFMVILSSLGAGYLHYLHARANYPFSLSWKAILFISGFIPGTVGVWALFPTPGLIELAVSAGIGGVAMGYASLRLFPSKMQAIVPKQ